MFLNQASRVGGLALRHINRVSRCRLSTAEPYALMVTVKVKPERKAECVTPLLPCLMLISPGYCILIHCNLPHRFLEVLAADVKGTRAEPDCLRFDLLRDESDENKFYFYSVYKSAEGLDFHRTTDHYKAWAAFRADGGIESQDASKAHAIEWQGD